MPLYEYQCTASGEIEEVIQKFSDAPLTTCSRCSGTMTKLISQSSFHLKGSGWYVTDYAKKSASASNGKDGDTKGSAGKTDASGDSSSKPSSSDD